MARFARAICCLVKLSQTVKRQTFIEHRRIARVKPAMTECDDRFNEASFVHCHRYPQRYYNVLRYITLCVMKNNDPQLCR